MKRFRDVASTGHHTRLSCSVQEQDHRPRNIIVAPDIRSCVALAKAHGSEVRNHNWQFLAIRKCRSSIGCVRKSSILRSSVIGARCSPTGSSPERTGCHIGPPMKDFEAVDEGLSAYSGPAVALLSARSRRTMRSCSHTYPLTTEG